MKHNTSAALFVGAGLLLPKACTGAADLGPWIPTAVNDQGVIVGNGFSPDSETAGAVKYKNGVLTALTGLGDLGNEATGIANNETAVGSSGWPPESRHAVYWDASGMVHDLGQLISGWETYATAINNAGVIIGESIDEGMLPHAWVFDPDVGALVELQSPNTLYPLVTSINDRGDIVGCIRLRIPSPDGDVYELRAAKWDAGTNQVTPLPLPGPLPTPPNPPPCAQDINESGIIVGEAGGPVMWLPDNTVVPLPVGNHNRGTARAINDAGTIVGEACDMFSPVSCISTAAKWGLDRKFVELAPPPNLDQWPPDYEGSSSAVDINAAGVIVGRRGGIARRFE